MDKGESVGLNTQKALYVALWDYNAIEEDELQLSKGDMVCASVDYLENSFGEWMVGENTRGKIGKFPATYVRAVTEESAASAPLAMNSNFDPDSINNKYNGASVLMTKADKSLRKFLKDNRAFHFYEPLVELGVENMRDLKLVLPSDLYEIGMDEDTITRILAVTKTPAGSPTNALGGASTSSLGVHDNVRPENTHRKHSIARAIVSSLSQTELQMLKDYLAECAPDNGPAGGDSEEAAETENGAAPSNKPPLPAKSALTSDQQTVLMSYVTAQFDALVQFQHIHRLFKNLFYVKTNLSAADLEAEEEEVPRRQSVVQEMEAHESFAERFTSAISQRRRNLGNTRALRPDMLQDGSCRFCRKLCKEVLAKLVEEQEALCNHLRAHALEAGCGDAILKHVQGTSSVYKAFADLQPQVQREIRQFIVSLEARVGSAATAAARNSNKKLRDRIGPLTNLLHTAQRLLSFPLRKVKEDALSLTRVSVLLPSDHSEAAAFKEVVALHHPERGIGAAANALATAAAEGTGRGVKLQI